MALLTITHHPSRIELILFYPCWYEHTGYRVSANFNPRIVILNFGTGRFYVNDAKKV